MKRVRIRLRGIVQGVGFRPFVHNLAARWQLAGYVLNSSSGLVAEVEGDPDAVDRFVDAVRAEAPPLAWIQEMEAAELAPEGGTSFEIRHSAVETGEFALISPDVATCPDCLRDCREPGNRRFGYPFTNCTNCGPRYTIIRDIPYDRASTTMAPFRMCAACQKEYDDPANRRFHAQPNACPLCGPAITGKLSLPDGHGSERERSEPGGRDREEEVLAEATGPASVTGGLIPSRTRGAPHEEEVLAEATGPASVTGGLIPSRSRGAPREGAFLAEARRRLAAGEIVAIKGLGGFHLACDPRNASAVERLRLRKRRSDKPFALMARDLAAVEALCEVSAFAAPGVGRSAAGHRAGESHPGRNAALYPAASSAIRRRRFRCAGDDQRQYQRRAHRSG
jgi:hydrogenase maturation protein HypF